LRGHILTRFPVFFFIWDTLSFGARSPLLFPFHDFSFFFVGSKVSLTFFFSISHFFDEIEFNFIFSPLGF